MYCLCRNTGKKREKWAEKIKTEEFRKSMPDQGGVISLFYNA
jgi:hypothetical protein